MDFLNIKKVLVLSPHTDDAELGCGAFLSKLVEERISVTVICFSSANQSLPDKTDPIILRKEWINSMSYLSLREYSLCLNFPVRYFSEHRQEILETMCKIRKEEKYDLVLTPCSFDIHQDHQVIHAESIRAFKNSSIFGYELPWNHYNISSPIYIPINEKHLQMKWNALQQYKSQIELNRLYFKEDFIKSLAIVRGVQSNHKYAEVFEAIRILST